MQKTTLFTILFSLIFIVQSFSQSLKLRLDYGVALNINSYRSSLFEWNSIGPLSTPEYSFRKLPDFTYYHFGIILEYDVKKRNHFSLGYSGSEVFVQSDVLKFNIGFMAHDSVIWVGQEGSLTRSENALDKISFEYARDFGKGRFRFSPFIGLCYAWLPLVPELNKYYPILQYSEDHDVLYPGSKLSIEKGVTTLNKNTWMGSIGLNLRIHTKKRELLAIKLYYQQGFRPIDKYQAIVKRNNKIFIGSNYYAYGSALHLKLSIPIPLYNFTEHKFFR